MPRNLKLVSRWPHICINSDPTIRPFKRVGKVIHFFPFMYSVLSFEPRIPRIHHGHTVVTPHSIDVPCEGGEPGTSKRTTSTRDDRVDHSHVIRIQFCQSCHLKVIVKEPYVVVFLDWIKESLVAFYDTGGAQNEGLRQRIKQDCIDKLIDFSYHPSRCTRFHQASTPPLY